MSFSEILSAVNDLSRNEQALLIKHTASLLEETGDTIDPELYAMLQERRAAYVADPDIGIPLRDAMKILREKTQLRGV
ncbi:MAG: hypothetical protein AAFN92_10690 [Bacteroidota bacterium]